MKKAAKVSVLVLALLLSALALAPSAGAGASGISVVPVMPPNQNPETRGYYDIVAAPGSTQEFALRISNTGSDEANLSISLVTATTTPGGSVNYSAPYRSDESLKFSFAEMGSLNEERMVLAPGEGAEITATVTMPSEPFDGMMLGSIAVLRELTDEEIEAAEGMIVNRFRHVVAVRIRMNDNPVETSFLLGDVWAQLTNGRASIVADVRNPQPILVNNASAQASIYPIGSNAAILEASDESVSFAPNSIFPFTLRDEAGRGIAAGHYLARIRVEHDGKAWDFEREFEVTAEDADAMNDAAVNQGGNQPAEARGLPTWAPFAAAAALPVIALIIIMNLRKRPGRRARRQAPPPAGHDIYYDMRNGGYPNLRIADPLFPPMRKNRKNGNNGKNRKSRKTQKMGKNRLKMGFLYGT